MLISFGQNLLSQVSFTHKKDKQDRLDYELGIIADACLTNEDGKSAAIMLCNNLIQAIFKNDIIALDFNDLLLSIARKQPRVFLDCFIKSANDSNFNLKYIFTGDLERRANPLSEINDDLIIDWCEIDPSVRYPMIAPLIVSHNVDRKSNQFEWTKLALSIIDNAPDVIVVLNEFKKSFRPMVWSGSRADILENGLSLISKLKSHPNKNVADWANVEEKAFESEIKSERKWEQENVRPMHESFE